MRERWKWKGVGALRNQHNVQPDIVMATSNLRGFLLRIIGPMGAFHCVSAKVFRLYKSCC